MFALLLILVTDQRKDSLGPGSAEGRKTKKRSETGKKKKAEQKIRDR